MIFNLPTSGGGQQHQRVNQTPKHQNKSKGFTLVELIVVVVILAIIIGVAISGIYGYVKKSRVNTDINNASAMQKVLGTLSTDKQLNEAFQSLPEGTKLGIQWKDAQKIEGKNIVAKDSAGENATVDENIPLLFIEKLSSLLSDGLPASKTDEPFYITLEKMDSTTGEMQYKAFTTVSLPSEGNGSGGGSTNIPDITPSHEHEFTIVVSETAATCTTDGSKVMQCSKCSLTDTQTLTATGHSWVKESETAATCTKGGTTVMKCSTCNETDTQTTEAIGHTWNTDYTVDKAATCTTDGSKSIHCTKCSATKSETTLPAGHNYGSDGKCTMCGIQAPGLYNSVGVMTVSWDDLIANGLISVTNGSVSKASSSAETALTGKLVIPSSVTRIEFNAFGGCTSLTSVTIPNSVTTIGNYAFRSCTSLTSLNIPSSVIKIEQCAFYGCTSLTSLNIPSSVTSISGGVFCRCTGLTSITIPSSVTSIESEAFWGCTSLNSVTIPNSVTSIGRGAFSDVPHIYYNGSATGQPWGALAIN